MSVEVKRVPLNFEWPLHSEWRGYVNTLANAAMQCPSCEGNQLSQTAQYLTDLWLGRVSFIPADRGSIPFIASDPPIRAFAEEQIRRNPKFCGTGESAIIREGTRIAGLWNKRWEHHLNEADVAAILAANALHPRFPRVEGKVPTPRELGFWSIENYMDGHTPKAQWACIHTECRRLGKPVVCAVCDGEGQFWPTQAARDASENWQRTEPPTGKGYQMWETVTSGSPVSPVFATVFELAGYMATDRRYSDGLSKQQWIKFIEGPGWAPSLMIVGGRMYSGQAGMLATEGQ